ncbi:hypothetical protein Ciccas_012916, partial [Cichlidogyrus casuarinus]
PFSVSWPHTAGIAWHFRNRHPSPVVSCDAPMVLNKPAVSARPLPALLRLATEACSCSLQCEHIPGRYFEWGSYKCLCRQGYEFQFDPPIWYFDGTKMEQNLLRKLKVQPNHYDILKCRQSTAAYVTAARLLVIGLSFLTIGLSKMHIF